MLSIDFSTDMQRILFWGSRMGVDLRHHKCLTEPYMWCQNQLQNLADRVVEYNGFRRVRPTDNRMLFAIAPDSYTQGPCDRGDFSGFSDGEDGSYIELPIDASSFFSPNRQAQWKENFHSRAWADFDCPIIPGIGSNALMDLVYTLQCLLPGMFLLVEAQDGYSKSRGIPPWNWICENKDILVSSIGVVRYNALSRAASDQNQR